MRLVRPPTNSLARAACCFSGPRYNKSPRNASNSVHTCPSVRLDTIASVLRLNVVSRAAKLWLGFALAEKVT
jgi:hypothetical protein